MMRYLPNEPVKTSYYQIIKMLLPENLLKPLHSADAALAVLTLM